MFPEIENCKSSCSSSCQWRASCPVMAVSFPVSHENGSSLSPEAVFLSSQYLVPDGCSVTNEPTNQRTIQMSRKENNPVMARPNRNVFTLRCIAVSNTLLKSAPLPSAAGLGGRMAASPPPPTGLPVLSSDRLYCFHRPAARPFILHRVHEALS